MLKIAMLYCQADQQFSVWFVPAAGMWKLLGVFNTGEEAAQFMAEVQ